MPEESDEKCPICLRTSGVSVESQGWSRRIQCSTCGKFYVSEELYDFTLERLGSGFEKYSKNRFILQGGLREKISPDGKRPIFLTIKKSSPKDTDDVYAISMEDYLELLSPIPQNPSQKIDKLLSNLEKMSAGSYGHLFQLNFETDYPLAYARDVAEFSFLLSAMNEKGLFDMTSKSNVGWHFRLSIDAWERIEENKNKRIKLYQGFVACWFADKHDLFRKAIERGIKNAGYEPLSIKEKNYPETVLSKALGEIRKSRFVVIDFTGQRDTVFVEFGFALGQGLETILVINKNDWKNLKEFYVTNYNVRRYSDEKDLEGIVETAILERVEAPLCD
jgi:hypothetical protein